MAHIAIGCEVWVSKAVGPEGPPYTEPFLKLGLGAAKGLRATSPESICSIKDSSPNYVGIQKIIEGICLF